MINLFVLRNKGVLNFAIKQLSGLVIDEKHPLELVIREHKSKRTYENNKTYWGRLQDIAEQVEINNRKFDAETWHEHYKRELLPDECAKGIDKWKYLPNGDRVLNMSTTDLNTKEFYDYRTQVESEGAGMGVLFTTKEKTWVI